MCDANDRKIPSELGNIFHFGGKGTSLVRKCLARGYVDFIYFQHRQPRSKVEIKGDTMRVVLEASL